MSTVGSIGSISSENSGSIANASEAEETPSGTASEASGMVRQESTIPPGSNKKEKRQALSQYWAFRYTFEKVDPKILQSWLEENTEAFGYQLEKGKKGQLHFQGSFDVGRENRSREAALTKQLVEVFPLLDFPYKDYLRRSLSKAAERYAMKPETRQDGPWYKGVVFDELAKELVYKIDITLRPWQLQIKQRVLDSDANSRDIWLFWEPKGGLGKTTFQKWIYQEYKNVLVLAGKAHDMKNAIVEYMDKQECLPEIIIINLPKSYNVDYFCPTGTEEIKDMFFYSGKYKGGMVFGRPPKVLVFGNAEPMQFRMMANDRLNIIRLPDGPGETSAHEEVWAE